MKIIFILLTCFAASGCAWQEYDKNNPDAYIEYWCKNQNESLLAVFVKDHNVDNDFPQIDPQIAEQQCIEAYLQNKDKEMNQRIEHYLQNKDKEIK